MTFPACYPNSSYSTTYPVSSRILVIQLHIQFPTRILFIQLHIQFLTQILVIQLHFQLLTRILVIQLHTSSFLPEFQLFNNKSSFLPEFQLFNYISSFSPEFQLSNYKSSLFFSPESDDRPTPSLLLVSRAFTLPSLVTGLLTVILYIVKLILLFVCPLWKRIYLKAAYLTFAAIAGRRLDLLMSLIFNVTYQFLILFLYLNVKEKLSPIFIHLNRNSFCV